jgi:hypothetical protein
VSTSRANLLGRAMANQTAPPSAELLLPHAPGESRASTDPRVTGSNPVGWLFPIAQIDYLLPHRIQFRDCVESQDGRGYARVNDTYDLVDPTFSRTANPDVFAAGSTAPNDGFRGGPYGSA